MDTSAIIRKATNDKEHEEYQKMGRCFECGKQGHLIHNCPNKKTRARTIRTIQIEDNNKPVVSETPSPSTSLAARVARLSEEDCCAFMDKMRSFGEDMDFQATWVLRLLLGVKVQEPLRVRRAQDDFGGEWTMKESSNR